MLGMVWRQRNISDGTWNRSNGGNGLGLYFFLFVFFVLVLVLIVFVIIVVVVVVRIVVIRVISVRFVIGLLIVDLGLFLGSFQAGEDHRHDGGRVVDGG